MERNSFYITTAIMYPNAPPHMGFAFEVVGADVLARYKRLCGYDVLFLTGLDEHGQKIQKSAEEEGITPQELVDRMSERFIRFLERLDISNDDLIRTTQERHRKTVQAFFKKVQEKGDIYKGEYSGPYCYHCESYFTPSQLVDGNCPRCGRPTETLAEEAYFFRMSAYRDRLKEYLESHPEFCQPEFRRNEMMSSFIEEGLSDLCISRSSITWGIPVPDDPKHVIYVWFDALLNYISAIGYGTDEEKFRKFWPADVHVVGKDIVRFHTIIWPTMLMSAGIPLPRTVFGHGFIYEKGGKMSKSKGNVIDPLDVVEQFGADSLRYFLLREVPFGGDGNFSMEGLRERYNNDLADDLGNLLRRTLTMIEKYFDGVIPSSGSDDGFAELSRKLMNEFDGLMNSLQYNRALELTWELIRRANRYVEESKPWELAKDDSRRARLGEVMYNLAEALRLASLYLSPFMPRACAEMRRQLGIADIKETLPEAGEWGRLPAGIKVAKGEPLFPKNRTATRAE